MTRLLSTQFFSWLRVARSAILVEVGLRMCSLDELASMLGIRLADDDPERGYNPTPSEASAQVRWAFQSTDRILFLLPGQSQCLRRALIAGHLLREHKPFLHIGARRAGRLAFHAWLELDGQIAADTEAPLFRRLIRARSSS